MKYTSLRLIKDEHRSLAAVLRAAEHVVNRAVTAGQLPDFSVLRAVLYYLREFPERRHHPHEDEHLFARIKARTRDADAAIAELQDEHSLGEKMLQSLTNALEDWESLAAGAGQRFAAALSNFMVFYFGHMQKEEQLILPVAERVLLAQDWHAIHAAFESNRDPMFGDDTGYEFRALLTRIMQFAPASARAGET
jgi:hemerythrin-like domain-containing protein